MRCISVRGLGPLSHCHADPNSLIPIGWTSSIHSYTKNTKSQGLIIDFEVQGKVDQGPCSVMLGRIRELIVTREWHA